MIQSLRDALVVCDLDNTLLTEQNQLLACNRATIELLCAMGGRFTVATVRSPQAIATLLQGIKVSGPVIACGGSVLYDQEENSSILLAQLNKESATQVVEDVIQRFDDVGVEVVCADGRVYVVQANQYVTAHLKSEGLGCVLCPLEQVPTPWAKISLMARPVTLRKAHDFINGKSYAELGCEPVNLNSMDIMPIGVDKAFALKRLCKQEIISIENTIVIGGHFSDIPLMKAAGYAVAVGNAPPEVKVAADKIVSNCIDGGAGEYLYSLVKRYTQSN